MPLLALVAVGRSVIAMATVTVMHEQMHQGTEENEEEREIRDRKHDVGLMLCPKEVAADQQEAEQGDPVSEPQGGKEIIVSWVWQFALLSDDFLDSGCID